LAQHKSAAKRARQAEKRRVRNRDIKTRMRTLVKVFQQALATDGAEAAEKKLRIAERELRRAASKGVIPKQRASRSVSRLAKQLQRLRSSA